MNTLGERIKSLRKSVGITQHDLAAFLGVNRAHISKVERGVAEPSLLLIKSICRSFGTNEKWLQTGDGSKSSKGQWDNLSSEKIADELEICRKISRNEVLLILDSCAEDLDKIVDKTAKIILGDFKFSKNDMDSKIVLKRLETGVSDISDFIVFLSENHKEP